MTTHHVDFSDCPEPELLEALGHRVRHLSHLTLPGMADPSAWASPQPGTAISLMWMPEISVPAPLDLRQHTIGR